MRGDQNRQPIGDIRRYGAPTLQHAVVAAQYLCQISPRPPQNGQRFP